MILDYTYHNKFTIEAEGVTLIIGYYKGSSGTKRNRGIVHDRLLQRPGKLYVLASRPYPDHFNWEILAWEEQRLDIVYIFSKGILEYYRAQNEDAIYIDKGEEYGNDTLRIQVFGSMDVGISFLVHLRGKSIFHAGNPNNWHQGEESTEQEIRRTEGDLLTEVRFPRESASVVDLIMSPVDRRMRKDYMKGV